MDSIKHCLQEYLTNHKICLHNDNTQLYKCVNDYINAQSCFKKFHCYIIWYALRLAFFKNCVHVDLQDVEYMFKENPDEFVKCFDNDFLEKNPVNDLSADYRSYDRCGWCRQQCQVQFKKLCTVANWMIDKYLNVYKDRCDLSIPYTFDSE